MWQKAGTLRMVCDLRDGVALKRVVGQIPQMDVTVPLVESVNTNVP